jgi:acyl-CoA thioesterase II
VRASQQGRLLFQMAASFHVVEQGLEFEMPDVPPGAPGDAESLETWCADSEVPLADWWTSDGPFEVRFAERPVGLVGGHPAPPRQTMWIRPREAPSEDPVVTSALLAFASDLHLLAVTLVPHGRAWTGSRAVSGATIDHAMWFHRPFHWTDWIVCTQESPVSRGARGFATCTFRDMAGAVVASAAQEGLLRVVPVPDPA